MSKIVTNIIKFNRLLSNLKSEQKKIVLCHGVFDVLHLGHLKYLEEAKKYGDILIVSITSDNYVKNKYLEKPYFNINNRAESLSYIANIDYIIISNSTNALKSINLVKPNYYVKGPDYNNAKTKLDSELIKEIKETKKFGGKFATTNTVQFSSSNILFNNFSLLNPEQLNFLSSLKNTHNSEYFLDVFSKKEAKVLIIGEAIIDQYIESETIGTSSKEPILVTKIVNSTDHMGGVISIANHLLDFSKKVTVLTSLGSNKSDNNKFLSKQTKDIDIHYIEKSESPIITKTRYIENYSKTKIFGSYNLNDEPLNSKDEKKFHSKINSLINKHDIIFLVDYGHGLISKSTIKLIVNKSKYLCVNKQLNSNNKNKFNLDNYKKCNLLCIQESEIRFHFKDQHTKISKLSRNFYKSNNFNTLIVTLGINGSLIMDKNNCFVCPTFSYGKIVDRVGAGDTFLSIAGLLSWKKYVPIFVLLMSSLAAGEKISQLGNSFSITRKSLVNNLKNILK